MKTKMSIASYVAELRSMLTESDLEAAAAAAVAASRYRRWFHKVTWCPSTKRLAAMKKGHDTEMTRPKK